MENSKQTDKKQSPGFFRSDVFKILIFVAGTIVLGALLAPLLYWGGKSLVAGGSLKGGWLNGLHDSMDGALFSRYFNRGILVGALIMLWPILRWMNSGKSTAKGNKLITRLGLEPNPVWWKHWGIGLVAAGIPILLLGWIYVSLDLYKMRGETGHSPVSILFGALGTGLAVAFLEEFVFRGALFAVMEKVLRPRPLLISLSAFFALVHFLHPPFGLKIPEMSMWTGFWMMGQIFGQFSDPLFLAAEFAVLFAIGWVLGYVRMKTASLWLGIGLHAGWVFGVKVLSPLTVRNFKSGEMMPWLGNNLRIGAVSCLVVCLTGLILWLWLRKTESRTPLSK